MLTDSNGIAAHLLLELMPELRWQDTPLGFIFKFINVIPYTFIWQTVVLRMLVGSQRDTVSVTPGTASSTAGAQAELGSG